jgi:hypothetical protein
VSDVQEDVGTSGSGENGIGGEGVGVVKLRVKERDVMKAVKEYLSILEKQGKIAWWGRMQSGGVAITRHNGLKTRYVALGRAGSPDLVCCLGMGSKRPGAFLAIECKGSAGRLGDHQILVSSAILSGGGQWITAYSVDDVERVFKSEEGKEK